MRLTEVEGEAEAEASSIQKWSKKTAVNTGREMCIATTKERYDNDGFV